MFKENILIVEDEFIVANDLKLMLLKAGYSVCGIAASVSAAQEMIAQYRPSWVLLDIFLSDESMGTDLAKELTEMSIGFIYISANTNQSVLEKAKATQPYGFLVKPFREKDMLIMLDIARHKHQENIMLISQKNMILQRELEVMARNGTAEERLQSLPGAFHGIIPFDFLKISIEGAVAGENVLYGFFRENFKDFKFLQNNELHEQIGLPVNSLRKISPNKSPLFSGIVNGIEFRRQLLDDNWEKQLTDFFQLRSKLVVYFKNATGKTVFVSFYSGENEGYNVNHLKIVQDVEKNLLELFQTNVTSKMPISVEKERSQDTRQKTGFEGIIGASSSLLQVLDSIDLVAAAPISVLILGESGTGKEQVSKAIHKRSNRASKPFIVVNCAALPADLIESELFGHEKGAFTGATDRRAGKFEAADGGTIFLDEIGELPLEAQVKLLRVLQEQEFERVGSSMTIRVNVRVIAATNRNMEKEVAEGRMRLDLYYRLNVFPIELPALRDRKEDIPLLAEHFIAKFSEKMNRNVKNISPTALAQLTSYNWPGNIRELEHLLERSTLMAKGDTVETVQLPTSSKSPQKVFQNDNSPSNTGVKTLEQLEKDHILQVLKMSNGKINGPGGAAEILGLPASTLNVKLKKYGISRDFYF